MLRQFVPLLCFICLSVAVDRKYFIASVEVEWDYATGGADYVTSYRKGQESDSAVFLQQGPLRIGHKYKKVVYKEYFDDTFSSEKRKPAWLGFVGPILKGETGDRIIIHYKNMASRNYSVHAHGVTYEKGHEGALYNDGTSGALKADDSVPPGGVHIYIWNVANVTSPASGDPDCLTWLYHSHVEPVRDTNSGLVGFIYTCRPGTLDQPRYASERQYALYVSVMDENLSWYLDENIKTYTSNPAGVNTEDEDFMESNKMHAINGYLYGHLPGLTACTGDSVTWHMASLGTETDVHSLAINGHSFNYLNHRQDSVSLNVAQFVTANMTAMIPGKWLISCRVNDHISAGMQAFFHVNRCPRIGYHKRTRFNNFRRYYIAVEEVEWDYGPSKKNRFDGGTLTEPDSASEVFFKKDSGHIGGVYRKAVFKEYRNFMFSREKTRGEDEKHLGFLGPVIRAEVGDIIKVSFLNRATRPYSLLPHGLRYSKFFEGGLYADHGAYKYGDHVPPNGYRTYYWTVPEEMGPTADDPDCLTRLYTSGVNVIKDAYSGLVGPMIICRRGALDYKGKQKGVDREFFLLFSVTDENQSWYLDRNIKDYGVDPKVNKEDEDFKESNLMHGINGRLYGNLPGLVMCSGDRVVWHVFSVGTEVDLHTVYFHGETFSVLHTHRSSAAILPGMMKTLDMTVEHVGTWGLSCRTNDHYSAGTKALYEVRRCSGDTTTTPQPAGQVETYFIRAEEIEWDYAPSGQDLIQGVALSAPNRDGEIFTKKENSLIGKKYKKVVFRDYTDATFSTQTIRPASESYLGILGPLIRLQVSDTLKVVFNNNASREFSFHVQGLFYSGLTETSASGVRNKDEPSVQPGSSFTYTWKVTEDSGPGDGDSDCINHAYFSDVDPIKDTNSGLVGPVVICKKGVLNQQRKRTDVQKDFALYFSVMDENESWYLDDNIRKYTGKNPSTVDKENEDFMESNKMHGINGYLYGNMPIPSVEEGNVVDWYLMALGTEVDLHSVHFHGNDITLFHGKEHTNDVAQLFPDIFTTVRMNAVNSGKWLFHCHVNDHIHAGMQGYYLVEKSITFGLRQPS